jgi:hypothetical protein
MLILKRVNSKKAGTLLILVLAAIVLIIVINSTRGTDNTYDSGASTTSTEESAQSDFKDGSEREIVSSPKTEGTIINTDSSSVAPGSPNDWSRSKNGEILVYTPVSEAKLVSNSTLNGESQSSVVYFRLIDDVRGVIVDGSLDVKDGKFSGVINFETTGEKGRLDIFAMDENGLEKNNVEIPVTFK